MAERLFGFDTHKSDRVSVAFDVFLTVKVDFFIPSVLGLFGKSFRIFLYLIRTHRYPLQALFEDVKILQYFTVKLDSKTKCFSIRKGINGFKK